MTSRAAAWLMSGLALAAATGCGRDGGQVPPAREAAYRENNRGVAALEQYAYETAATAFRRAIELDGGIVLPRVNLAIALYYVPDLDAAHTAAADAVRLAPESPQAAFVQGLIARSRNDLPAAAAAFERVLALDPDDVGALVNLAQMDLQERRVEPAVERFRAAVAREPFNATATYGLGQALIRAGANDEGAEVMARFEALRETGAAITYSQTYLEQGRYAEAVVSTGLEPDLVDDAVPDVRFVAQTASWMDAADLAGGARGEMALALTDLDGDGAIDLAVAGEERVRLFRWDGLRFVERASPAAAAPGLGPATGLLAADLDNDTRADLVAVHERGFRVYRQEGGGTFQTPVARPAATGRLRTAALLDVDHDGDLDVLAGGPRGSAPEPALILLQNDGGAQFADITARAGLAAASAPVALAPTDFDNGRDIDVLVVADAAPPALFSNQRDGTFRNVSRDTGLDALPAGLAVAAGDFNKDGRTDFAITHAGQPASIALSSGRRQFRVEPGPVATAGLVAVQAADYDNDGLLDIVGAGARGLAVFRNVGARFADVTAEAVDGSSEEAAPLTALALGDIDGDGDLDVAAVARGGALRLFRNDGGSAQRSLAVVLRGAVSNRSGVGAKVDIRAGSLWQRLETTAATPAVAPLDPVIGLGTRDAADVVRVLWPAGIVQAETLAAEAGGEPRPVVVTELNRKPSSCPYLYTWNGETFEFVTDFLGGGEMGYWTGPHGWNTPDSDEYVRIAGSRLVARGGRLELRVTNELEEVLYLDQIRLLAVEHPPDVEVYPREGMRASPATDLSLAAVRNLRPLRRVVSARGADLTAQVARRDGVSAQAFVERPLRGYAEPHAIVFDLPPSPGAGAQALLLTGWTDYAFSSDNVAAAQRGWTLDPPRLDRQAPDGRWLPLVTDVGVPVGRPQTIVVDIGRTAGATGARLRLSTSMRIHWDAIAVADLAADVTPVAGELAPEAATLRWRGYSLETVEGAARVPQYSRVSLTAPWKVLPGRYTREGDVRFLLDAADDRFVVARTGDEIAIGVADAPGRGGDRRARTFLLHAVGFSKEMDLNSSSPDHVLPLPYRGITAYPPPPPPPAVRARQREMLDRYNTRIVTRPLPTVVWGAGH